MLNIFKRKKTKTQQFQALSANFGEKREKLLEEFNDKHKGVFDWAKRKGIKTEDLIAKSAKGLAAGAATSAMVLISGFGPNIQPQQQSTVNRQLDQESFLASLGVKQDVSKEVKKSLQGVNLSDEKKVAETLSKILKIPVKPELEGKRLNATFGIMGYESHLTRYPGEALGTHFRSDVDFQRYSQAAMAGGPGAWGYIAISRNTLTQKDIEREKYYLVAQTFLSPNWGTPQVKEWFRHRKMVVVNPQNGEVVVGALEDAGPDPVTGRKFGGSPEVMEELGFSGGGSYVLMFFVDDPKDKVPLGGYGR